MKGTPTWEKMDLAEAACLVSGTKSRAMFRASALGMSLRSIRRHKTCVQGFDISIDTFRIRQFTPAYSLNAPRFLRRMFLRVPKTK